jgi:hypothetical protein
MKSFFSWKNVTYSLIFLGVIFLLSNLGLLPSIFWNLWPLILIFINILFWVTLVKWLLLTLK